MVDVVCRPNADEYFLWIEDNACIGYHQNWTGGYDLLHKMCWGHLDRWLLSSHLVTMSFEVLTDHGCLALPKQHSWDLLWNSLFQARSLQLLRTSSGLRMRESKGVLRLAPHMVVYLALEPTSEKAGLSPQDHWACLNPMGCQHANLSFDAIEDQMDAFLWSRCKMLSYLTLGYLISLSTWIVLVHLKGLAPHQSTNHPSQYIHMRPSLLIHIRYWYSMQLHL